MLVSVGGAHPRARVLILAASEGVIDEGEAVVGEMEDVEAALGGIGAVRRSGWGRVVEDGLDLLFGGSEVAGGDGDGRLDDLKRCGIGREVMGLG